MAMGHRDAGRQQDLFVTMDQLPKSIGHVFYGNLNELLAEAGFDYFEGMQSQRGVAWRCADSLSLRRFLGIPLTYITSPTGTR